MVERLRLQDRLERVFHVVRWTLGGAVSGGAAGFGVALLEKPRREPDDEEDLEEAHLIQVRRLLGRAEKLGMLRRVIPTLASQVSVLLTHQEYCVKLELERQGYYPCSRCGHRHQNAGPDSSCLAMGAYWSEETEDYVEPGDERWTPEGYKRATGEPWSGPEPVDEDPEEDEEPLH